MSHKADSTFFDRKREWSSRKDSVLRYYLKPYLTKLTSGARGVTLVDGFAGPGVFGDGEEGSPLIVSAAAREINRRRGSNQVEVICVESDPELASALEVNLRPFTGVAEVWQGVFLDQVECLIERISGRAVFLYLDPFAVIGLDFEVLDRFFRLVQEGHSVEVLLNFNSAAFGRCCRAALGRHVPEPEPSEEDAESDDLSIPRPDLARLDAVVGGEWWREIFSSEETFAQQVAACADGLAARLRVRFPEAECFPIKAQPHHTVPKYHLVFATRVEVAIGLVNDAANKAFRTQAQRGAGDGQFDLFDIRDLSPHDLTGTDQEAEGLVLEAADGPRTRDGLVYAVIRGKLGRFSQTQLRNVIVRLVKRGVLSHTGSQLSGTVVVRRAE